MKFANYLFGNETRQKPANLASLDAWNSIVKSTRPPLIGPRPLIQSVGIDSEKSWKHSAAQPSSSQLSACSMMAWWSVSWTTVNPLNPSYWSTESSRVVSWPQRCSVKISAMLSDAFRVCEPGIGIRNSADGKLFNPRRMQAVTKVRKSVLRNFLFADDCTRNEQEMQAGADFS